MTLRVDYSHIFQVLIVWPNTAVMKWKKKYNINLKEVHEKNINGDSLTELSIEYGIPKTTLNRYLTNAGYKIQMNRKNFSHSYFISKTDKDIDYDYSSKNTIPWKQALVFHFGHKCRICGYDKIVEAHHIIPTSEGGSTSLKKWDFIVSQLSCRSTR